ncbi:MAG: hypothetical protein R3A48_04395 [Polyangiales bacterium]
MWTRLAASARAKGDRVRLGCPSCRGQGRVTARQDRWLLVRRSIHEPFERAYYLSDGPAETPLAQLAPRRLESPAIEQCFGEAKDDVGLDQYEVRGWVGWYRYITLCMMAAAWVASVRTARPR